MVGPRGRSSMVERQLPKLHTRVRFPSPAPILSGTAACGIYPAAIGATADNIGYQPATVCPLMTQSGHWLCTAAKALMPVSAPSTALVCADTILSPELGSGYATAGFSRCFG